MIRPTTHARRALAAAWRHRNLTLPVVLAAAVTASASGISLIRIKPGDTLSGLAVRYHTTVARLIALNNLPGDGDLIYAGQMLKVPASPVTRGYRVVTTRHVVRPGDTLDGIAAHFHVSPARLARRNHLANASVIVIGHTLTIKRRVHTTSAPSTGGSGTPAALRDRAILARHAEPSRDQVAAMIRSTSARYGLDSKLALAIAWQESGWNMRVVSGVDAIGAMQIMPYTGTYLSTYVVHRRLDLYNAQDNITAGVALLSVLMRESHSAPQSAAGYYQGLTSVRRHGMLPATKQYVADVMALRQRF